MPLSVVSAINIPPFSPHCNQKNAPGGICAGKVIAAIGNLWYPYGAAYYIKCAFRNNGATAGRNILAYSGVGNTYTKPDKVFLDAANGRYTEDSYARP